MNLDNKATSRERYITMLVLAVTAIVLARRTVLSPGWPTDFDQLWHGARALLDGRSPYSVIGPGLEFSWDWPLYYPMPAVLLTVPLALIPVSVARLAFSTIVAATLGWAMGARIRTHWPMLLSASFIISMTRTQWGALLLATAWLPAVGFAIAAKPSVGLATLASLRERGFAVAVAGCIVLVILSFVVQPSWLNEWLAAIRDAPHIQPAAFVLPAGPLLGLAILRWRRRDARLFLALVLLPHTPSLYDLVVLFYLCRTFRESLALAVLTQILFWGIVANGELLDSFESYTTLLGKMQVIIVYLPVLTALLLRPNANEVGDEKESIQPLIVLPQNWPDAILLSLLLVGGTLQILLPF